MESWQRNFITRKKPFLIENISCSEQLMLFLKENHVLSSCDVDCLRAFTKSFEQANELLTTVQTRIDGYQKLAQGLFLCRQREALNTLLEGVTETETTDALEYCGIKIEPEHIYSTWILFEGNRLQLKSLTNQLTDNCLKSLDPSNDSINLLDFVLANEDVELTKTTTCDASPSYLPRKLLVGNKLKSEFFTDFSDDIFLIEHIKENELWNLAEQCTPKSQLLVLQTIHGLYSLTSKSSVSIKKVAARFILLEKPIHFWTIAQTTERNVHWIRHNSGKYEYIRSDGNTGMHRVKRYLLEAKQEFTETGLRLQLLKSDSRNPVIVFGSPGVGKTLLIQSLAAKLKSERPTENVIYLEMKTLVKAFLNSGKTLSCTTICETIASVITCSKIGTLIQAEFLCNPRKSVELFIDSFDEVPIENKELALDIIKCMHYQSKNIRLIVACRPHWASDLENALHIIGYEIARFNDFEQLSLILNRWSYNFEVDVSNNEVVNFAKCCLQNLKKIFVSEIHLISGIPLQCRIFADVSFPTLQGLLNGDQIDLVEIRSIYKMYDQFVKLKLGSLDNLTEQNEIKMNKLSSREVRRRHYLLACAEVFPEIASGIAIDDLVPDILKFGIVELGPTQRPRFIHRTIAEFYIANQLLDYLCSKRSQMDKLQKYCKFLFNDLFAVTDTKSYINYNGQQFSLFHYQKFWQSSIVYFLNSGVSERLPKLRLCTLQKYFQTSGLKTLEHLETYLCACSAQNLVTLFKLFMVLYSVTAAEGDSDCFLNQKIKECLCSPDFHIFIPDIVQCLDKLEKFHSINWRMLLLTASKYSSLDIIRFLTLTREKMLGANINPNFAFTDGHITPLHIAINRGSFHIFENFYKMFQSHIPALSFLVHSCLFQSLNNETKTLTEKKKILNVLLKNHPNLLNKLDAICGFPPILTEFCHLKLIKVLIKHNVNVNVTCKNCENLAHKAAKHYSASDFHDFVMLMVSKNMQKVFTAKDKFKNTPLHLALLQTDVLSETLKLLRDKCDVDYNSANSKGNTPLLAAVEGMQSTRVLEEIERLGGNVKIRNKENHSVLCVALLENNLKAFKYFLPRAKDISIRCSRAYIKTIWFHALNCSDKVQQEVVPLLANASKHIPNNTSIYVGDTDISGKGKINNFFRYKSPLALALATEADSETVKHLKNAGAVRFTTGSVILSLLSWLLYIAYTQVCFPIFSIYMIYMSFRLVKPSVRNWCELLPLTLVPVIYLLILIGIYFFVVDGWNLVQIFLYNMNYNLIWFGYCYVNRMLFIQLGEADHKKISMKLPI